MKLGSTATEQAIKYVKRNKKRLGKKQIVWGVRVDNESSIKIAKKNGFVIDKDSYSDDGRWINYILEL